MSNPTAKKYRQDAGDDGQLGDETMPMPALSNLLENTEPSSSDADAFGTDSIAQRLERLIELSESMNGRLDRIAELLANQGRRGKPRTRKNANRTKRGQTS